MKILLANLAPEPHQNTCAKATKQTATLHFPTGMGIIAQCLKKSGRTFDVIDTYVGSTNIDFIDHIAINRPSILLLSGFVGNYFYGFFKKMTVKIKSVIPSIIIILGGPMATVIPEILIKKTLVDYIVLGEGENTVIELLDVLDHNYNPHSVAGICYAGKDRKPIFTQSRERIPMLDASLFPNYDAFPINDYIEYLNKTNRCWELHASRGCVNRCTFCNRIFGNKLSYHNPISVVSHMRNVYLRYGINRFNFVDDNFLNSSDWIDSFLFYLGHESIRFKWRFQGRINAISVPLIERMKSLGLIGVSLGLESGNQRMLNRYNKNISLEHTIFMLSQIIPLIDIHGTFIIGGPDENYETIEDTANFIKRIGLRNINAGILTLFPGSMLYRYAINEGYIVDEEQYCLSLGPVYQKPYVNLSSLPDKVLIEACNDLNNMGDLS